MAEMTEEVVFSNLVIDRVLQGLFEQTKKDANGKKYLEVIGALNQIQNLTINTTTDPKDAVDARGVLIKRFYTSKNVEVSGENAIMNLDLAGLQFGNPKANASSADKIVLPRIMQIPVTGTTITLEDVPIEGTLTVYGCNSMGLPEVRYTQGESAKAGVFVLGDKVITLPTDVTSGTVQIKYEYETEKGAMVLQTADKFPETCQLTLSVLACEPCDPETLRHVYIVFPSFQLSPDVDLSISTDGVHAFSGSAQVDYCSADKRMFYIAMSDNDTEE